jgi:hypothetical protein
MTQALSLMCQLERGLSGGTGILAILLLSGIATAVSAVRAAVAPKEDALMLPRYSEHLAQGFGFTWNVGEKPVEGATDFLYMVMVAGVSKVKGIDVIDVARLLISVSFLALPLLVFSATLLTMGGNRWFCAAIALYMAAGPGAKYIRVVLWSACCSVGSRYYLVVGE